MQLFFLVGQTKHAVYDVLSILRTQGACEVVGAQAGGDDACTWRMVRGGGWLLVRCHRLWPKATFWFPYPAPVPSLPSQNVFQQPFNVTADGHIARAAKAGAMWECVRPVPVPLEYSESTQGLVPCQPAREKFGTTS